MVFSKNLALRKIRCGLPTGNHSARQFSRKYAILKRAYLYLYIYAYICKCMETTRQGKFLTESQEYALKSYNCSYLLLHFKHLIVKDNQAHKSKSSLNLFWCICDDRSRLESKNVFIRTAARKPLLTCLHARPP